MVILLASLLLASHGNQAPDGISLKFTPNGAAKLADEFSGTAMVKLTATASGLKVPKAGMKAPIYGQIEARGKKFLVAVDPAGSATPIVVVDSNGNGDLSDDPAIEFKATTWPGDTKEFTGTATITGSDGIPVSLIVTRYYSPKPEDAKEIDGFLFVRMDFGYQVSLTLDGKTFDDAILGDSIKTEKFNVDRNGDGRKSRIFEVITVGKPFNMTGTTYVIKFKDGAYELQKASKPLPVAEMPPDLSDGATVPAFTAKTTDGKTVRFPEDYRGKIVMLDFWATWCGPCCDEIPYIVKAFQGCHSKGYDILGVSLDAGKDAAKMAAFTQKQGMAWPQILDGKEWNSKFVHQFDVDGIPFAVLVDGDTGKIVAHGEEMRGDALMSFIERGLAKHMENARRGK